MGLRKMGLMAAKANVSWCLGGCGAGPRAHGLGLVTRSDGLETRRHASNLAYRHVGARLNLGADALAVRVPERGPNGGLVSVGVGTSCARVVLFILVGRGMGHGGEAEGRREEREHLEAWVWSN